MGSESERNQVIEFLNHQLNDLDEKVERLQIALDNCEECLEANGLQATLHNAEIQHDLLSDLLMGQVSLPASSLNAAIMQRVEQFRREANRLAQNWQRGRETPPAYWDVEVQQAFLTDLLARFHAYMNSRPLYADSPAPPADSDDATAQAVFPWFVIPTQSSLLEINRLREDIYAALRRAALPFDHLELLVEANGQVIVTGYAHDDIERQHILNTIAAVEGISQVVTDVKVVCPDVCPVCHPPV